MDQPRTEPQQDPGLQRRIWAVRVVAGLCGAGLLALLAPLSWSALSGGVGLLALGALGVLGVGLFQTLPLLGQTLENRLLAARKAEARANPIEQLQNFLLQKRRQVNDFKGAVVAIATQIASMADMIDERKRKKPGYDASRQEGALRAMQDAHKVLVRKYQRAEAALEELADVIEDRKFEYKFGQAGKIAIQTMNATSGQDLIDQMLADEAFDSVRDNFHHVFADLELEAAKLSSAKQLAFDDGMHIDLSSIHLVTPEQARS